MTLTGSVQDQTGAAIPGASLTLTPQGGGPAREAVADDQGKFSFSDVAAGQCVLKASADKFEDTVMHLTVGSAPLQPIRVTMMVKAQEEEVTVSAAGSQMSVNPAANTDVVNLDENTFGQIPTDSENLMPVLSRFLAPASHGVAGPSIIVDGVETESLDVSTASIKHIHLDRNPYSVRFRRPGTSRIEVTTQGGRHKEYHGEVGAYGRDSVFDARNAFSQTKPDLKKALVEARLMGPIPGLPVSFFLSGERLADDESAVVNAHTVTGPFVANVPTVQNRTCGLGRLDFRPSQYNSINVRYNYTGLAQSGLGVGGIKLPEQSMTTGLVEHSFNVSDRYVSLKNFVNQLRFRYEWIHDQQGTPALAPALQVEGDFIGGPSQTDRVERRSKFTLQDAAQYIGKRQSWTFGAEIHPRFIRTVDASNFAGTFYFDSLSQFTENDPLLFTINRGQPAVDYTQHEGFGFLQDDIKVRSNLDITVGARYEWHDGLSRGNGILPHGDVIAPRLGIAFAPFGDKTILRAGAGLFYDEYPRQIIRQTLLLNGIRGQQLIIRDPLYPDPFAGGLEPPPSITRTANNLALPRLMQASFGVEQALNANTQLTVDFRTLRGEHLYRSRDVNAPMPSTEIRPDPNLLNVIQVESSAMMHSNEMDVTLSWNSRRWLSGTAQYVLSRTIDDTDGPFSLPADSYNLRPELGRASYDRRHRLNLMSTVHLPWGFSAGTIVAIGSGIPYNITTGKDLNDSTAITARPAGVSRNTGKGPGLASVDMRLTKSFNVWGLFRHRRPETDNLSFSIDAFNVFNHTNFNNFIGVEKSHFFGMPNSALPGREIQFSLKYQM